MKTKLFLLFSIFAILPACMPMIHPAGTPVSSCRIEQNFYITKDAIELPLRLWEASETKTKAVIIALHGFNDYSHFFQKPGEYFSQQNIISYAYDQRGFGEAPNRGLWAGVETYIDDLECFIEQVADKHPGIPVYLLGESMGGQLPFQPSFSQASQQSRELFWQRLQYGQDKTCRGIKAHCYGLYPILFPG